MKFKSLGQKVMFFAFILIVAVCLVMGVLSYRRSATALGEEVDRALHSLAVEGSMLVRTYVESELSVLETLASRKEMKSMDWEQQKEVLQEEENRLDFLGLGVVYPDGTAKYPDGDRAELGDRGYVQQAFDGESNVSNIIISRVINQPVMMFAVPIGHNEGVLIARADGTYLSEVVAERGFGERGFAYMVDQDGSVIAHENEEFVMDQHNFLEEAEGSDRYRDFAGILENMVRGESGIGDYYYDGHVMHVGFTPVEGTEWSFAVGSYEDEILAGAYQLRNIFILVSVGVLAVGFVCSYQLGRSIAAPIKECSQFADNMATGDFTGQVPENALRMQDELGVLAKSFEQMQESIGSMLQTVNQGARKVSSSSESLAASSEEMNASLEEVAASTNEFADNAQKLNTNSQEMDQAGSAIAEKVTEGNAAIENAVNQMQVISDIVGELKDVVINLDGRAQEIGKIVDSIKDISEQTNMLALNAAIEAARAGEQGQGFAVVADEVRKLAEQSSTSAAEITELVVATQQETQKAVSNMDRGVQEVENGTGVITSTGEVLKAVIEGIDGITRQIEKVAEVSQEIGGGSQEVSAAVEEQTATMGEISSAANDLQGMVEDLQEAINQFKH